MPNIQGLKILIDGDFPIAKALYESLQKERIQVSYYPENADLDNRKFDLAFIMITDNLQVQSYQLLPCRTEV